MFAHIIFFSFFSVFLRHGFCREKGRNRARKKNYFQIFLLNFFKGQKGIDRKCFLVLLQVEETSVFIRNCRHGRTVQSLSLLLLLFLPPLNHNVSFPLRLLLPPSLLSRFNTQSFSPFTLLLFFGGGEVPRKALLYTVHDSNIFLNLAYNGFMSNNMFKSTNAQHLYFLQRIFHIFITKRKKHTLLSQFLPMKIFNFSYAHKMFFFPGTCFPRTQAEKKWGN